MTECNAPVQCSAEILTAIPIVGAAAIGSAVPKRASRYIDQLRIPKLTEKRLQFLDDRLKILRVMLPAADALGVDWLRDVFVRRRADDLFPGVLVEAQHQRWLPHSITRSA
ncbi:MAG TPA: hypothetical protein VJ809_09315 [Pirellulales bacterium]|nr:hypothetical protein [Pirellulales bacterium]